MPKHIDEINRFTFSCNRKVKVGNDQEMAQSERNSHSKNREVGEKPK